MHANTANSICSIRRKIRITNYSTYILQNIYINISHIYIYVEYAFALLKLQPQAFQFVFRIQHFSRVLQRGPRDTVGNAVSFCGGRGDMDTEAQASTDPKSKKSPS